jgi:hypothetical protein
MAGSTTGVPMSPGYGGCQTATPRPYYTTTTYATTGSYTTKAQECSTIIHDAPSCYTESRSRILSRVTSPESCITTPRFPSTTSLRQRNTTRICMLPLTTTPRPGRITVPKRSRQKKKSCPNCSASSVTNWIPHRVTNSQLWVNILIFTLIFVSIYSFLMLF